MEATDVPPDDDNKHDANGGTDQSYERVVTRAAKEPCRILAEIVTDQGCGNDPQESGNHVQDREAHRRHAGRSARRRNYNTKSKKKPAHQEKPIIPPGYPINDPAVDGFFRKAAFKPRAAAHAGGCVIELRAHRICRQRNERYRRNIEIASAGEKRTGNENRLAFENDTGKQQKVTVFEE